jgi:pilus assembly protein CpaF
VFGKRSNPAAGGGEAAFAKAAPAQQSPSSPVPGAQARLDGGASAPAIVEGGRSPIPSAGLGAPLVGAPTPSRRSSPAANAPSPPIAPTATDSRHSESYYETKSMVFGALIEAIDLAQLAKLDAESSREEIRDIVNEIIAIKALVLSISEQEELLDDICNDVLGYGPLEPLLARDDIADIMVNGSGTTYIEVQGKIQKTGIRFRDNQQLLNICQRIVSQIGRRWTNPHRSAMRVFRTGRAST